MIKTTKNVEWRGLDIGKCNIMLAKERHVMQCRTFGEWQDNEAACEIRKEVVTIVRTKEGRDIYREVGWTMIIYNNRV